jgi:hypothetical protein
MAAGNCGINAASFDPLRADQGDAMQIALTLTAIVLSTALVGCGGGTSKPRVTASRTTSASPAASPSIDAEALRKQTCESMIESNTIVAADWAKYDCQEFETLSPATVVRHMPPAMAKKYESRLAEDSDFNYFADTLEELSLEQCGLLAWQSKGEEFADPDTREGYTDAALTVIDRMNEYLATADPGMTAGAYADDPELLGDDSDYQDFYAFDDTKLVDLSLKYFCPELKSVWTNKVSKFVKADVFDSMNPDTEFDASGSDASITVGNKPDDLRPGTYRARGPVHNCYWERSTNSGATIDNDFVTYAPNGVTVTLHAGEGFTSSHCGTWARK